MGMESSTESGIIEINTRKVEKVSKMVIAIIGAVIATGSGFWATAKWLLVPMMEATAQSEVKAYGKILDAEREVFIQKSRAADARIEGKLDTLEWQMKYLRAFARYSDPEADKRARYESRNWR
jgi:hypothetical protein